MSSISNVEVGLVTGTLTNISQGILSNREARLGVLQQSIASSQDFQEEIQAKNVRQILSKYKGDTVKKETASWLDEMESIENQPSAAATQNFTNDKRDSILQKDDFSDIEMIRTKYMNIFGTQK